MPVDDDYNDGFDEFGVRQPEDHLREIHQNTMEMSVCLQTIRDEIENPPDFQALFTAIAVRQGDVTHGLSKLGNTLNLLGLVLCLILWRVW
jgi:hypothetical protein